MPFTNRVRRRWALGLSGTLLLVLLGWIVSPRLLSFGDKGEILRPELALVPPDAFVFVHLRSGDVWDHDLTGKVRALIMEFNKNMDIKEVLPVDPAGIDSISLVIPSAPSFARKELKRPPEVDDLKPPPVKENPKEKLPDGDKLKDKDKLPDGDKAKDKDKLPEEKAKDKEKLPDDKAKDKEKLPDDKAKDKEKLPDDKAKDKEKLPDDKAKDKEKLPDDKAKDKEKLPDDKAKDKEKLPDDKVKDKVKLPDDKVKDKENGNGPDDFQGLVIVTMKTPNDQARAKAFELAGVGKDAKEQKHNGKAYQVGRFCLHFASETIVVVSTSEAVMKKVLERPEQVRAEGAQAAALNLAMKKHHLVIGLNLDEPTCLEYKKQFAMELKHAPGNEPFPVWMALPLLETQLATLTVDLGKESRVRVQASMTFPDSERAADAVGALQDVLVLGRVFTLGQLIHSYNLDAGLADNRQEIIFLTLVMKQAEAALRGSTVERRQAVVRFQAEGQFDIDYLRGKAKIAAENFVVDEGLRRARQFRLAPDSIGNLKFMTLAMHSFHDAHMMFPPPAICSKEGTPLLSWRVALLPYIEEGPLYQKFKLDEAWDSPHNIKLLPHMPRVYAPLGIETKEPNTTFYQVLVGPDTAFELVLDPKSPFGARGSHLARSFPDGVSNTIAIVEAADPVPWTKPADLTYDPKKALPRLGGTMFPDGFHCSMADGIVRFVKPAKAGLDPVEAASRREVSEATLRNAITRSDGMPLGADWNSAGRPR